MKMEQIVFRNVGIYNSDAGKLPKRKHTKFTVLVIPYQATFSLFQKKYITSSVYDCTVEDVELMT